MESVDSRLQWMTNDFKRFCKDKGIQPYLAEISRESLCFPQSRACPVGKWSKGLVATQFLQYFEDFSKRFISGKTDDPVLTTAVACSCFKDFSVFLPFVPAYAMVDKNMFFLEHISSLARQSRPSPSTLL